MTIYKNPTEFNTSQNLIGRKGKKKMPFFFLISEKKNTLLPPQRRARSFIRRCEMSLPRIQCRWLQSPTGRKFRERQPLRHSRARPVLRLTQRPRLPGQIGWLRQRWTEPFIRLPAQVPVTYVPELPLPREPPLSKGLCSTPTVDEFTISRNRARRRLQRRRRGFVKNRHLGAKEKLWNPSSKE